MTRGSVRRGPTVLRGAVRPPMRSRVLVGDELCDDGA